MDSRLLLFNFIGQAVEVVVLFLIFFFSRLWIGQDIIGIFGWLYPASVFFIFISDLGVGIAHVKFFNESDDENHKKECNGSLLFLKIIQISPLSIVLVLQALFSKFVFESILISIGLIMHQIYEQITVILLQSEKKVIKIRLSRTLGTTFRLISLYIFVNFLQDRLLSLTLSTVVQSIILLGNALYFFRHYSFGVPSKKLLKKYLKYIVPFIISTSSIILMQQMPPLLYNLLHSDDINLPIDLGDYTTAFQLYSLVLLFPPLVSQVLLPTFSKMQTEINGNQNSQHKIILTHKYLSIIHIFLVVFSFIFTDIIISTLFGPGNYQKTGLILNFLLLSKVFELYSIAYVTDLQAKQHVYYTEAMSLLNLIIYSVMLVLFISPNLLGFKIEGVSYAIALSSLIYWTIFDILTCLKYKYKFYWKVIPILLTFLFVYLLSTFILRPFLGSIGGFFYPLIEGCISMVIFIISFFGFKILNYKDLNLIKKILNPKNLIEELKSQLENKS